MSSDGLKADGISVLSSIADSDVIGDEPARYNTLWYFDALSDNGKDAVIVTFSNFNIFSSDSGAAFGNEATENDPVDGRSPTVSFEFYRNGRSTYKSACEYKKTEFVFDHNAGKISIGSNFFEFGSADYGQGYSVRLNLPMAGRGRLKVRLEWLFIESDLTPDTDTERDGVEHIWNVVAPRADVTGRIEIENGHKTKIDTCHFRGSGYHDKRCGNGVFLSRFAACEWGRVHFPDSTAAYLVGKDAVSSEPFAKLLIIRDNELRLRDATVETQGTSRSSAGLRYDHKITMRSEDALELKMRPVRTVRSGIYLLRFICEATLKLRDGRPRKTFGLSSHLSIRRLRQRWLTKLTDLMTIREKTK